MLRHYAIPCHAVIFAVDTSFAYADARRLLMLLRHAAAITLSLPRCCCRVACRDVFDCAIAGCFIIRDAEVSSLFWHREGYAICR